HRQRPRTRPTLGTAAAEIRRQAGPSLRGGDARHGRGVHERAAPAAPRLPVANHALPGAAGAGYAEGSTEMTTMPGAKQMTVSKYLILADPVHPVQENNHWPKGNGFKVSHVDR